MGIQNFKHLLKKSRVSNQNIFDHTVIDGSNLVITFLSVTLSEMHKTYGKNFIQGSNVDILKQCAYLVKNTAKSLRHYLEIVKNNSKKLYVVMDPLTTPEYIIKNINNYTRELFNTEENIIKCNLKLLEQEKRRKSDNVQERKEVLDKKLKIYFESENLLEFYPQLSKILISSMLLNFPHQITKLMHLMLDEVVSEEKTTTKEHKCEKTVDVSVANEQHKSEETTAKQHDCEETVDVSVADEEKRQREQTLMKRHDCEEIMTKEYKCEETINVSVVDEEKQPREKTPAKTSAKTSAETSANSSAETTTNKNKVLHCRHSLSPFTVAILNILHKL